MYSTASTRLSTRASCSLDAAAVSCGSPHMAAPPATAPPQMIARRESCARVAVFQDPACAEPPCSRDPSSAPMQYRASAHLPTSPFVQDAVDGEELRLGAMASENQTPAPCRDSGTDLRAGAVRVGYARSARGVRDVRRPGRHARRRARRSSSSARATACTACRRFPTASTDRPGTGGVWQAQFAWQDPPVAFDVAELQLGARLVVALPEPGAKRRLLRAAPARGRTAPAGEDGAVTRRRSRVRARAPRPRPRGDRSPPSNGRARFGRLAGRAARRAGGGPRGPGLVAADPRRSSRGRVEDLAGRARAARRRRQTVP